MSIKAISKEDAIKMLANRDLIFTDSDPVMDIEMALNDLKPPSFIYYNVIPTSITSCICPIARSTASKLYNIPVRRYQHGR